MNKQRRKEIEKAASLINEAEAILRQCEDEEQEYVDNMPENLHETEKYEQAEQDVDSLSDAAEECYSIAEQILGIIE